MEKRILLVFWSILMCIMADARSVRGGIITESQPDGTSITLISYGDEFYHITKTVDGCAVIKELDGWWYYAVADGNGVKESTGYKVGKDAPGEVIAASRNIPAMSLEKANRIRTARELQAEAVPLMRRIQQVQGTKASGTVTHKHGIVLLAEFKDTKFKYTKSDFQAMLTQKGYNRAGATGCAKEYFESQFGSSFVFDFDVSDVMTLSQNRSYYGANDSNGADRAPEEMVIEACKMASARGIDFSKYDQDNDGEVDNVFVIFAGDDEAEYPDDASRQNCIWSHAWYILDGAGKHLSLNGKTINRYACTAELSRRGYSSAMTGIGTFCHEYSHTFGLPDYYDTDYEQSRGMAAGLWGVTSLMDSGNQNNNGNTPPFFNALDRELLGIGETVRITSNGTYSMKPIGEGGCFYRIDTDNPDEYYLLEYRQASGWDKYIKGSGMLIYHVDKSGRPTGTSDVFNKNLTAAERWGDYNEVNAYPAHQCADLVEADGRRDSFTNYEGYARASMNIAGIYFPHNGSNSFSATSRPAMEFWSGAKPEISITQIKKEGNEMTFFVSGFDGKLPEVTTSRMVVFQDAAIISFSSPSAQSGDKAKVLYGETGKDKQTVTANQYERGQFSVVLEGLKPSVNYDVKIAIETEKGTGKETQLSFLTGRHYPGAHPFISLKDVERLSDGSFKKGCRLPLRVWNGVNAAKIQWYFKEKPVEPAQNGFFTPEDNGQLKAVISWEDGSQDIIIKEIRIR